MDQRAYWRGFAEWAAQASAPPPHAVAAAVDAFLDTIACILAGKNAPAALAVRAISPENRMDAMALATAAHALDWDDYDAPSVAHPSAVLVPTVLSMATDISGPETIAAYLVGLETMDRLGEIMNPEHYECGWHATGTLGTIGAAVAAGATLRLTAAEMTAALSLAAGMASGLKAQFGSPAKPVTAGLAARNGVLAARLAAQGVTGNESALLGEHGFLALHGPADWALRIPNPPGAPWAISQYGLIAKPHPCCGYLARLVDGAIDVSLRPGFKVEDIKAITVIAPARNAAVLAFPSPTTPDEARFSPAYCIAAALTDGILSPDAFTPAAMLRDEVTAVREKITFRASTDPQSAGDLSPDDPDIMKITWRDRATETLTLRHMRGGPNAPLTHKDYCDKLRTASASGNALIPLIEELPTAPSARSLISALKRAML